MHVPIYDVEINNGHYTSIQLYTFDRMNLSLDGSRTNVANGRVGDVKMIGNSHGSDITGSTKMQETTT